MYEVDVSGCGCCEGISVETPVRISNLPGLPALAYRVGIYTQFKHSMQTRLSDKDLPGLHGLTTRSDDDFTIALLDSWAMACDILTFYQERIANESYKGTATDRSSLLELARLVRYNLQPGVAADTYLVYTLDDTPGAPGHAFIDLGTKAQSLPNPGEVPQVFEANEAIVAQAQWNAIKPVSTTTQPITASTRDLWFVGTNTNLKPGDAIVIIDDPSGPNANPNPQDPFLLRVQSTHVEPATQQTHVFFDGYQSPASSKVEALLAAPGANLSKEARPLTGDMASFFKKRQPLTDTIVSQLVQSNVSQSDLETLAVFQGWSTKDLFASIAAQPSITPSGNTAPQQVRVSSNEQPFTHPLAFALRVRASLFGYNAPDWKLMPDIVRGHYSTTPNAEIDWPYNAMDPQKLDLDRIYSQIIPGSWIVVELNGITQKPVQIKATQETTGSNYALNLKITHLELKAAITQPDSMSNLRKVTVYAQSEPLTLAQVTSDAPISGATITVNGVYQGLGAGRRLVVTGKSATAKHSSISEFAILDYTKPVSGNLTVLHLQNGGLQNGFLPDTVTINANVVTATQGESVQNEIIGSGDASQPFQRFTLRQSPLTYVQAPTPEGKASTLQVFVNTIQWQEVGSFYGRGPREHIFVTHIGDDQKVTVQFGDGKTGARLPTGEDNVLASYRTGTGTSGLVLPGQISLLKTRPLGVKGVSNPLAPTGAIDPDTVEDARRNADNTVRTLGRIVSGSDYETFARSYAAVAKALATVIWNSQVKAVYVTIAGPTTTENPTGTEITQGEGLYNKIYTGMRKVSDPTIPFFLQSYTAPLFRVSAHVKVHPDFVPGDVLKAVEKAVLTNFSFDARNFGQDVYLKEVIAVTQKVPGVVTLRFDTFYRMDKPTEAIPDPEKAYLTAVLPTATSLAELLLIDPIQPFDSLEVMP
jgi:predicted phage baseplate assembly protein